LAYKNTAPSHVWFNRAAGHKRGIASIVLGNFQHKTDTER
jgi:hypothetical protein